MVATGVAQETWWAYAEGNRYLLGVVVALVAAAAIIFVARRVLDEKRRG